MVPEAIQRRQRPAKFVFVNRFFFPDHSATAQMLGDLTFYLAGHGHRVTVVTSRQRYEDARARLKKRERVQGVDVIRIGTTTFGRKRLALRVVDYLSFYVSAAWHLLWVLRRDDIVIFKTDPPMLSTVLWPIAAMRRAQMVNWLQDLFPETAAALKVKSVAGWPLRCLLRLRNWGLRKARWNVCIGGLMASRVQRLGVDATGIVVLPNWSDGEQVRPIAPDRNGLRRRWDLQDHLVIGYSGNLGRAHPLHALQAAIAATHTSERLRFLFIGGGVGMAHIQEWVKQQAYSHVLFKPYQPRAELSESLSVPDLHLACLEPSLEGLIVPSKVYGIAAAGRPCLFIGSLDGEVAKLLTQHDAGIAIPDQAAALIAAIDKCLNDDAGLARMGNNARCMFERGYDRRVVCQAWEKMLLDGQGQL